MLPIQPASGFRRMLWPGEQSSVSCKYQSPWPASHRLGIFTLKTWDLTVSLVLPPGREAGVSFLGLCLPLWPGCRGALPGGLCLLPRSCSLHVCASVSVLCCEDWVEKHPELRLPQWCCRLEQGRGNGVWRCSGLGEVPGWACG